MNRSEMLETRLSYAAEAKLTDDITEVLNGWFDEDSAVAEAVPDLIYLFERTLLSALDQ